MTLDPVLICPCCTRRVEPPERADCPFCGTPHHARCLAATGVCSAVGCRRQVGTPPPPSRPEPAAVPSGPAPAPLTGDPKSPGQAALEPRPPEAPAPAPGRGALWTWMLAGCLAGLLLGALVLAALALLVLPRL